ncbi:hypothetical protein KI387_015361, partial [Taxus chinensis]
DPCGPGHKYYLEVISNDEGGEEEPKVDKEKEEPMAENKGEERTLNGTLATLSSAHGYHPFRVRGVLHGHK